MKTAYVLSGGGAKGCFQVGVMKQLHEKGVLPDIIYGTSTGALQASGYAKLGMVGLEESWLSLKSQSDVMAWNWWPHILTLGLTLDGKYNFKPLRKRLEFIESLPGTQHCEVVVTKVSLKTGEIRYCHYSDPDFLDSVLASCSVPFVNTPINGEWVDGGVRDQIPVAKVLNDDYDKVVFIINNPVHINPPDSWKKPSFLPLLSILIRVADGILSAETWLDELRVIQRMQQDGKNIEVYMPDEYWMDTQDYVPAKIRQGIDKGYNSKPIDLTKLEL